MARPATEGASAALCAAGFLAAAALRVALVFSFPGNYDTQSWEIVAGIEARGGNLYTETDRYNYSPVWGRILQALDGISRATGLGLTRATGLFLLAVDAGAAWMIARLVRRRLGHLRAAWAALLFFANPVSVLVSSAHMQFDGIGILFLLAALLAASSAPRSALALSASLLAKHVTWYHPLLFARRAGAPKRAAWFLLPYALFLLSFLPRAGSWRDIGRNVFGHRGQTARYGIDALLLVPGMPPWAPTALFLAVVLPAAWFLGRGDLERASLKLFLVVLIFLPGFGRQYCVWPIALGSLAPGAGLLVYTAVATGFFVREAFLGEGTIPGLPGWYGPWWAAVIWLLLEVRRTPPAGEADGRSGLRSEPVG
ncbi:MAG: hypothetical protein ABI592_01705 [Acidobacteriota bacterium]